MWLCTSSWLCSGVQERLSYWISWVSSRRCSFQDQGDEDGADEQEKRRTRGFVVERVLNVVGKYGSPAQVLSLYVRCCIWLNGTEPSTNEMGEISRAFTKHGLHTELVGVMTYWVRRRTYRPSRDHTWKRRAERRAQPVGSWMCRRHEPTEPVVVLQTARVI